MPGASSLPAYPERREFDTPRGSPGGRFLEPDSSCLRVAMLEKGSFDPARALRARDEQIIVTVPVQVGHNDSRLHNWLDTRVGALPEQMRIATTDWLDLRGQELLDLLLRPPGENGLRVDLVEVDLLEQRIARQPRH